MSLVETSIDCVHQRLDRLSSKRKLDDYDDEDFSSDLVSVRMRKDELNAVSSTCNHQDDQTQNSIHPRVPNARWVPCNSPVQQQNPTGSLSKLQFFVRLMSDSKTLVLQMDFDDTVKSVHERIQAITGIPMVEQRLIYRGKQLQWEQSLTECSIENDGGLQLVGRMRSTTHPEAWQMLDEMVSLICRLCKNEDMDSSKYVKPRLTRYLSMIPDENSETVSERLQIFISSCAPAALVMLYLSPYKGNKECADETIRQFISLSQTELLKSQPSLCASILLEICKLLGQVAGEEPLYCQCRSTLGSMVEHVTNRFLRASNVSEASLQIKDIFPFATELASRLSKDMLSSIESPMNMGPTAPDIHDFSAFLLPLRTVIIKQLKIGSSIQMPLPDGAVHSLCFGEEIAMLYDILTDLMAKMELCLSKMEQCLDVKERRVGEHIWLGWCQYLAILKELHSISRLYQGAENQFWMILEHRKACISYLIVRYAQRSDDHRWLLEHKNVTDFESRRHLAMMLLPEGKDEYDELHEMLIDRAQLLPESFEYIAHAEPDALRGGLFLEFKNEEATGPGVLREWFFLVCQALFNPQNALFVACPNDRRRFFPNPASKVDPLHLEYFTFSGRIIALALMHKVQVGIVFDRVFFLQLAGKSISLDDIRDADPYLHSSCKKILEMDAEVIDSDVLSLTFVREVEELGSRKTIELCPGGKSLAVNSRNRGEYVSLLIHHCFVASISEQVAHFAQGFADILCNPLLQKFFFQSLELEDLDWMLHGSEKVISVDDWKAHTEYNGFKETDLQILWFWKIVEEMSAEQRKVLLFFWTSVKYLPVEGFRGLASRLYIYHSQEDSNHLPSSHTCFYRLCMPSYPVFSLMKEHFNVITQEHIGCSFGTW